MKFGRSISARTRGPTARPALARQLSLGVLAFFVGAGVIILLGGGLFLKDLRDVNDFARNWRLGGRHRVKSVALAEEPLAVDVLRVVCDAGEQPGIQPSAD